MASTHKKDASEDVKRDQKLQAVMLCDSFSKSFRPITLESPKVLLPLMNIPMLEYTIEFLAQNGVEELFVFSIWHAEMLQDYINKSDWPKTIAVKCINSAACSSAGDALRELDALGVIRSDPFILMSADTVCNFSLANAIEFHRQKRKEDSNCIMTLVLKKTQDAASVKPIMDDLVIAMDASTSQIVLFENDSKCNSFKLPTEIILEHPHINFNTDLLDCHIDICSPELMLQFSDNFDYQDIRADFIRNEAVNFELGMHIYGYILENEYAARVQDLKTYHAVTRDIVSRWTYPIVSDAQLLHFCDSNYKHIKRYVYFDDNVKASRSADITESVLGKGTTVASHVIIEKSTIGLNCHIGSNVTIIDSHIWDNVVIEDNVTITQGIICSNAHIKKGATVSKGGVISFNVIVGENFVVPEFTRIFLPKDSNSHSSSNTCDVGSGGTGEIWIDTGVGDDYDFDDGDDNCDTGNDSMKLKALLRGQSIGCKEDVALKVCRWEQALDVQDDSDDEVEDGAGHNFTNDDGFLHNEQNNHEMFTEQRMTNTNTTTKGNGVDVFIHNVGEMVSTGFEEGHPAENVLMEIKGYKFSQNKLFSDCLRGVIPALMQILQSSSSGTTKNSLISFTKTFFTKNNFGWNILRPLIQGSGEEVCIIESIETEALKQPSIYSSFRFILQIMYDSELISDESLLQWITITEQSDNISSERRQLFNEKAVQEFVEWVKQNDDDDDEDESDDDDEED